VTIESKQAVSYGSLNFWSTTESRIAISKHRVKFMKKI